MLRILKNKQLLHELLDSVHSRTGKMIQFVLLSVNLFACVHFVYGTGYDSLHKAPEWFLYLEYGMVTFFALEYLLRLYAAPSKPEYIFSFYGLIDLLSILPTLLTGGGFTYLKALRTLRILRFLRYFEDEYFFFGRVSPMGLQGFKTIYTVITIIFIASALIYEVEGQIEGTHMANYFDAVYYTVITLSTVGYGDITPVTTHGRTVTVLMIFAGMIFIPWQVGKLARIFIVLDENRKEVVCKSCGCKVHDADAVHCKMCGELIFQEYQT